MHPLQGKPSSPPTLIMRTWIPSHRVPPMANQVKLTPSTSTPTLSEPAKSESKADSHGTLRNDQINDKSARQGDHSVAGLHTRWAKRRALLIEREVQTLQVSNDSAPDLEFEVRAYGRPPESVETGCFDARHLERVGATRRQLAMLRFNPASGTSAKNFDRGVRLINCNRLIDGSTVKASPMHPIRPHLATHISPRPWRLDNSIWAPRRDFGNSRDFFETTYAIRQMILTDWRLAAMHHDLAHDLVMMSKRKSAWKRRPKEMAINAPEVRICT